MASPGWVAVSASVPWAAVAKSDTALVDALHPRGIFERSDLPVRKHEGLGSRTGTLFGEVPEIGEIELDGMRFVVPLHGGQKTGMYLDQRFNRRALLPFAAGRRMLDVFCNSGSFLFYAMSGGAGPLGLSCRC